MKSITAKDVVDFLNELLKIDKYSISGLMQLTHQRCNDTLAKHPTVQVRQKYGTYRVGVLGVLNGLFGIIEEGEKKGHGHIVAIVDEEDRNLCITRFVYQE